MSPSRQNLLVILTALGVVAGLYTTLHLALLRPAEGEPAQWGETGPAAGTAPADSSRL